MSNDAQTAIEGGTYEVIRARLAAAGEALEQRIGALNSERQSIFGAVDSALLTTERITTEHACTPRDMTAVGGGKFLFGYNVQLGLKSTTELADVFSVYRYDSEANTFLPDGLEGVDLDRFAEDFSYLYKYYRETSFVKFLKRGAHLYLAFRSGKSVDDVKAFKFLLPGDGTVEYLGNRFDHEYLFPPQQEFEWKRAHRDMHRGGEHPHISINDRVFVETVGGDLTVKVEDNTASGGGIYAEPVENVDQTLDDAEILYAEVGSLILLKIRPYQEEAFRYLVFCEKTNEVFRADAIADSCVLLPDDHGIVVANGFVLQTGEAKFFDSGLVDMRFERRVASSNGEDTFFVFYNRASGTYILLAYNLIGQSIETPVVCNGYSLFPDGRMLVFRTEDQPQKHHAVQIWQTPFMEEDGSSSIEGASYLAKIGNAEVVRCMAECREVLKLIGKDDTYADLYIDLVKKTRDIVDSYFWVGSDEAQNLREPLMGVNTAAQGAIAEFDKVQKLRAGTAAETARVQEVVRKLLARVEHEVPDDIQGFVHDLAGLRGVRGEVVALRDRRYVDQELVNTLEESVKVATETASNGCVQFLLEPQALDPYRADVGEQEKAAGKIAKVTEAEVVEEALDAAGEELEMLIDVVGNLKIEDTTEATAITESISDIYAELNRVRAGVRQQKKELSREEGAGQYQAQVRLLGQAVANYLELCDTPERCDDSLTKVMIQLEELEGRFGEFDEYVAALAEKREEVYGAFETRKQQLLEARNRRAATLEKSAMRVLDGIVRRVETFSEQAEINSYFAGDLMVDKVRDVIEELRELGDPVKADGIQTRLKTLREDAVRQFIDRKELYEDGGNVIKFGDHAFSVNTRDLELTLVPRDEEMAYHLTGTGFYEEVADAKFLETREVWDQEYVSESRCVYRAEWLAYQWLLSARNLSLSEFMAARYGEGYVKGVHDRDAQKIIDALIPIREAAGLLEYSPEVRAGAMVFWAAWEDEEMKSRHAARLLAAGVSREAFGHTGGFESAVAELREYAGEGAEFLGEVLAAGGKFPASAGAVADLEAFHNELKSKRLAVKFKESIEAMGSNVEARYAVLLDWMGNSVEAAAVELCGGRLVHDVREVETVVELTEMLGDHSMIEGGRYQLDYHEFMARLGDYAGERVPLYERYHTLRSELVEAKREDLRLASFKPHVMSAFVRNRLLDEVYLPMIGANLAKQIGAVGAGTRTDRMGLLLLVSPPGYGKTTLMEYVANRLGITFVKINGPALGHDVTSLDPVDAPNASAREEVERLNLSLEMGDNVMIYVDDIQHCNPEFLQKFISLCDGQRKIEGVWDGKAKTYDLRGKKVAVVMAGNPYTETGGKFQIPDMLANRADTYNLGDIIGENSGAFESSYLENSLTSNPVLSKLAGKGQGDVRAILKMAAAADGAVSDELEGNFTAEEVSEFISVARKLLRVRDTILRVNLEYIRSAAMEDSYRTEPAFKLQGSYRNMNRIAEKVLPVMTDDEVERLIHDHYRGESQTLTTGAEANLLKFFELEGEMASEQAERWTQIKTEFNKQKLLGGAGEDDPVSRVVAQMMQFQDGLRDIAGKIGGSELADSTVAKLEKVIAGLRAVPVEVEIKVVPVEPGETSRSAPGLPVDVESRTTQGME